MTKWKNLPLFSGALFVLAAIGSIYGWDPDPNAGINNSYHSSTSVVPAIAYDQDLGVKLIRWGMDETGGRTVGSSFTFNQRDIICAKFLDAGITIHCVLSYRMHVSHGANQTEWESNFRYFCEGVMNHFKGKISYYIIDNEPDVDFGQGIHSTENAVALTRVAYEAAKGIDSAIQIESPPVASPDNTYLRAMIAAGITNYCDVVGFHAYGGQIDSATLSKPWDFMALYPQYPQRPAAASECGYINDYSDQCSNPSASRAFWFAAFNVATKRCGLASVLLFDLDGHGDWALVQSGVKTPAYDMVKYGYVDKELTNGDFETATSLIDCNEWMTYSNLETNGYGSGFCTFSPPVAISIQSDAAHGGTKCLRINNNNKIWQISGKLTPGVPVTISAWTMVSGSTAFLRAEGYNRTAGKETKVISSTDGIWKQTSLQVTPTNPWVVVGLSHSGVGYALFDDITITDAVSAISPSPASMDGARSSICSVRRVGPRELQVVPPATNGPIKIILYDMQGRCIQSQNFVSGTHGGGMLIRVNSSGWYRVQVELSNRRFMQSIIVQ